MAWLFLLAAPFAAFFIVPAVIAIRDRLARRRNLRKLARVVDKRFV